MRCDHCSYSKQAPDYKAKCVHCGKVIDFAGGDSFLHKGGELFLCGSCGVEEQMRTQRPMSPKTAPASPRLTPVLSKKVSETTAKPELKCPQCGKNWDGVVCRNCGKKSWGSILGFMGFGLLFIAMGIAFTFRPPDDLSWVPVVIPIASGLLLFLTGISAFFVGTDSSK